jgi:ParB family chromosome partitioning protein
VLTSRQPDSTLENTVDTVVTRRRNALGRGLGALIPGANRERDLVHCPIDDILPPAEQPRTAIHPEKLRELADSIRQSGVLQPVLLRRQDGRYRLVAGERRWRAAKMAGLERIPALVKDIEEDQAFALALIENIQREDLTPLEEALAFRRLIDEHGFTQKTLAETIGKARSTIANTLRLLELPDPVRRQLADGQLTAGHARAVLSVPKRDQATFAEHVINGQLTVRQAEAAAKPAAPAPESARRAAKAQRPRRPATERGANLDHLEQRLRESLHTRVCIVDRGGRGKVELHYDDDDMLQEIVDRLLETRS